MSTRLALDSAALTQLVTRQLAVAQELDACAKKLGRQLDWARTPAQRTAAAALNRRLAELSRRVTEASSGLERLAERMGQQAAIVRDADRA